MVGSIVKWKQHVQVGWSVGYCRHCQSVEAVRIENEVEVTSVYFIPVRHRVIGRAGRCDFCERPQEQVLSNFHVDCDVWTPAEGLPKLLENLGIIKLPELPPAEPDARLRSLLSATEKSSALTQVNVLPGMIAGLVAGGLVGLLVGIGLFELGFHLARDRFGSGFVALMIGMAVGAVAGATIQGVVMRPRTAEKKILTACRNYPIDMTRLEVLACEYNDHVQSAVRAALHGMRASQAWLNVK